VFVGRRLAAGQPFDKSMTSGRDIKMGDGLGTSSQKRMGLDEEEKNLAQIYSAYVERKG
jgi:hypothetical protein